MIISVASGKGGTGKTTVAVNLALSLTNVQFLDCDVEEPNAGIFLNPKITIEKPVHIPVPTVNYDKCNFCGRCSEVCQFNAIAVLKTEVLIFLELCHGCGACSLICPTNAINEKSRAIGTVRAGKTDGIDHVEGVLNTSEPMVTPLVRAVKKEINSNKTVIIDVAPGVGCPVIESIYGCDYCILVTEPTPFGLYDLTLVVGVLRKMNVACGVVINRDGIGDDRVDRYCQDNKIPMLMRIPFSKEIASAYSRGISIISYIPEYKDKFRDLYEKIEAQVRRCK